MDELMDQVRKADEDEQLALAFSRSNDDFDSAGLPEKHEIRAAVANDAEKNQDAWRLGGNMAGALVVYINETGVITHLAAG